MTIAFYEPLINNCSKLVLPLLRQQVESPTALQRENLPPTQFHMVNVCCGKIPKLATAGRFVETRKQNVAVWLFLQLVPRTTHAQYWH